MNPPPACLGSPVAVMYDAPTGRGVTGTVEGRAVAVGNMRLMEETGVDVRFPLDVQGADVLLITPSVEFFAGPHIESLMGSSTTGERITCSAVSSAMSRALPLRSAL